MGRLAFAEAVYLLLRGELPTPAIGKLFGAVLVSSLDHGVTPPSTLAARNVATTGAPLRDAVAAGIMGFGAYHGGDIEPSMRFLQEGLALRRDGASYEEAARAILAGRVDATTQPAGVRPPRPHARPARRPPAAAGARARSRRRALPPAARRGAAAESGARAGRRSRCR